MKEHYSKYRKVPTRSEMESEFPNFDIINTDGVMDHWISRLKMHHARQSLTQMMTSSAAQLEEKGPYHIINLMAAELSRLGRDTALVKDVDLIANHNERLDNLRERIEQRANGRSIIGVPSGVARLDEAFGGWQQGDFIVIAGWTGSLKSWLALYFAINAWLTGHRVLYISLEMSSLQIGYRFDTLMSGINGMGFTNNSLTHATEINFDHYKNWLGELSEGAHPFTVVTNEDLDEVNQNTVLAKIEHWKPDVCILDYHGLFDDASGAHGETEKAQPLDAKILTPNGWKLMGEVEIGDAVIGSDGRPTKVTGISPQQLKPIYRVEMSDGSSTECCEEHLWAVNTRTRNHRGNEHLVKPLSDIKDDLKTGDGGIKWSIPIPKVVQFDERAIPVDPYMLGLLIGDGSFVGSGLHFSTADQELVDYITKVLPDTHAITKRAEPDTYGYYITGEGKKGQNKVISGIRELDLWGKRGEFKFVPELYLHNSEHIRREMLAGLLDSDGCASSGVTTFSSSSKELAEGVRELVSSLGGTSLMRMIETTHLPSWKVSITIDSNPFKLQRKADLWKPRVKYGPYRGIRSVEYVGEKVAQCIRVANEDGLYVTDDYIITHNTKNLSKAFKRMAIKTGVPIIDITGVTQDKDKLGNVPPELGDLAWSKQLAYDSDLTMALCYNEKLGTLEVVSRKVRRGKSFRFWLDWDVDKGIVTEQSNAADNVFITREPEPNET